MGIANYLDIFQQKMNDLFHGFESMRAYIDGILILTKGDREYHVHKSELTINILNKKGLTYNIEKSLFDQTEMEFLGFWVTRDGVMTTYKKYKK